MKALYIFVILALLITSFSYFILSPSLSGHSVSATGNAASIVKELAGNSPFVGNSSAPVVMIDFSDPQCPSCRQFHDYNYPIIKQEYIDTGKVEFVSVNVILPQDPMSIPSFMAASCARKQLNNSGSFKAEDIIYEKEHNLGSGLVNYNTSQIKSWIKSGMERLNYSKWEQCFDSNETKSIIENNNERALNHNIYSLPTVYVNDVPIVGNQPYSIYKQQIDQALASS